MISLRPTADPAKVWLQLPSGEGGAFPAAEVAAVLLAGRSLAAYFDAHF